MFTDEMTAVRTRPAAHLAPLEARGSMSRVAALALAAIGLAALGLIVLFPSQTPPAVQTNGNAADPPLFRDWQKPDLAIVLSGQQYGYLQPCGCTRPQYGGLARRFNFLKFLKDKGWPVAAVDLGDVAQKSGPQTMLKYVTSMKALQFMQYTGVGIGVHELALDLTEVLAEFALNNEKPRILAANLANRDQVDPADNVKPWATVDTPGGPRLGVAGVVAPSLTQNLMGQNARFHPVEKVLPQVIGQLQAQKAELLVLLFQGSLEEAKTVAGQFPQFQLILCHCREDEPPGRPDQVKDTLIIRIGHKGRYVGVIGAARTRRAKQPFELRYEMVRLGEEFETLEGKEASNPVHALLENYTRDVRDKKLLASYPRRAHPVQVEYPKAHFVGSDKCKSCHKKEHKIWEDSPHSHAFDALLKATRPGLRNFDGECVKCHVVGFDYHTGFRDEQTTKHLLHVGCESCHGPGSEHVKDKFDDKLYPLMNPWRAKENENAADRQQRLNRIDRFCQECHDIDNDAHWSFEKKWPKIDHVKKP